MLTFAIAFALNWIFFTLQFNQVTQKIIVKLNAVSERMAKM